METKVIKEEPMFILSYDSYNSSDEVSIYVSDIKAGDAAEIIVNLLETLLGAPLKAQAMKMAS